MAVTMKKKITPKDMNPKALLATDDTVRQIDLGVLIGQANGVTTSVSQQVEVLEGLTGRFKFQPFKDGKPSGDPLISYVLWLPSGMGTDLFELPREKEPVEFAFIMSAHKAENPAGYEWGMKPLLEAAAADPLGALEAKVAQTGALPDPDAGAALPAPDAAPAASKAKDKATA